MKVVILCGGYGTRIRDVAESIPKPMITIGPFPILWHIMRYYGHFDFRDFVLCLGYKSSVIKDFFINYHAHTTDFTLTLGETVGLEYHSSQEALDWRVTLAQTGLDVMTGSRVKAIRKYIGDDENFMLTYGDGVGNVDLTELLRFHKAHGRVMTVTGVHPPGRFGEIMTDADGHVSEFNEKPQSTAGVISGGFFVCRREIFDYIGDGPGVVFEQEPMRRLVREKQLMLFGHEGFWQPMDTHREYILLNDLYNSGKAPWVVW